MTWIKLYYFFVPLQVISFNEPHLFMQRIRIKYMVLDIFGFVVVGYYSHTNTVVIK